jgi:ankyrin repeat protein/GTPase SAR1 family protein
MTKILFDNNHISLEEIKAHQGLIQRVLSGELKYPQLKLLAGVSYQGGIVYRAKIDKKNRLIFTYHEHEGQKKLLVLAVNNHNYKKLRRQFSAPQSQYLETEVSSANDYPVMCQSPEDLSYQPTIAYKGKTLILDEYQQGARGQQVRPQIFLGPAGTGKSCILYSLMLQQLNEEFRVDKASSSTPPKILYLSPSERLISEHQKLYQSDMPESVDSVQFCTWNNLLQSHYPERTLTNDMDFEQWLKTQKIEEPSKIVHYEFSLMVALGVEKYRTLGQRQCYYSRNDGLHCQENTEKQGLLLNLLSKWQAYLEEHKRLDPMVHALSPNQSQTYAGIYLDETQNLPPVALSSLIPRVLRRQLVAALDSDQCLFSSPYMHNCLKELLYQHYGFSGTENQLLLDWRSRPEITAVANHLLNAKYRMDGANNKRRPYKEIESRLASGGQVSWVDKSSFSTLKQYSQLAGTVLIAFKPLSPEERLLINEQIGSNNILTPEQAIGLEFDTAILWNPFSDAPGVKSLNQKDAASSLTLDQWNAFNALYVSLKRAQQRLFIFDEEQARWAGLANNLLGELPINQLSDPLSSSNPAAERDRWWEQVRHHLENKNYEQAKAIMRSHLKLNETEITEHIKQAITEHIKPAQTVVAGHVPANRPKHTKTQTNKQPVAAPSAPSAPSKQAALKATTADEYQGLKKLVARIQKKEFSAINALLKSSRAKRYLFDAPPHQIATSIREKTLIEWLNTHYQHQCATALKNELLAALKLKKASTLMSFLCERSSGVSLFDIVYPVIKDNKKLVNFIKNNTDGKLFNSSTDQTITKPIAGYAKNEYGTEQLIDNSLNIISLITAVTKGDTATLQFFYDQGIELDAVLINNQTLAYIAAQNGQKAVLEFLHEKGVKLDTPVEGWSPIHIATQHGHKAVLEFLHEKGVKLDTPKRDGWSPIHTAARMGHTTVLEFLHEKGVKLDTPHKDGWSSIHIAAQNGQIAVLEFLHEKGVKLDTPNQNGWSPIHIAAQNGHKAVLEFLHEKGVKLDTPNKNGWSPIHIAAQSGHKAVLEFLHEKGVKLDTPNQNGATPVCIAAQHGQKAVLEFLHEKGVKLDTPNQNGWSPIHFAAQHGHKAVLEFLHEKGVKLDTPNKNGWSPIHIAAQYGQKAVLEFLHEKGVKLDTPDKDGWSPIHIAAQHGQKAVLEFLHEKGVKLDTPNQNGATPVCIAAQNGQKAVLEFLHEKGVKLDTPKKDGWSPIHIAAQNGQKAVLEFLHEKGVKLDTPIEGWSPIHIAARMGHTTVLEFLHEKGVKLDTPIEGWSPIHIAAQYGQKAVLEFLHEKGVKLDTPNQNGWSPIHIAAQHGHKAVLEFLHEKGVKLDTPKKDDWSPIHIAAQYGQKAVLEFLHEKGVKLDTPKKDGWSPIHIAAQNGHKAVLEFLHEKGVKLDTPNQNGWSPIHIAAQHGHKAVLEFLHEKGVKLDTPNKDGWSPIHIAAQNGHKAVLEFLHEKGVKLDAPNRQGATPTFIAARKGHSDIILFLFERKTYSFAPINTTRTQFNNFINHLNPEIKTRAEKLIPQDIQVNPSEEGCFTIMPHEIAQIMGHQEIATLLLQHPSYPHKGQVAHVGLFSHPKNSTISAAALSCNSVQRPPQ